MQKSRKLAWVVLGLVVLVLLAMWLFSLASSHDPLHFAVFRHDITTLKSLIAEGHDVNQRSRRGSSDRSLLARLLLNPVPEFWVSGDTPLHVAAMQGLHCPPHIIHALIQVGADPSFKNDFGQTPLDYAKLFGTTEHVRLLSGPGK